MVAAMLGTTMPAFHLSMEQNGSVALAQALGLVIASLSTGPLIDSRGKKTALVTGLAITSATLYLLPNAAGFGQIVLCLFLLGFGGGVIVTAANALASDISPNRRASLLNFLNLFFGLGGMATPFLAANLLNDDAAKLFYLGAILTTITLLVHVVTPMPPPVAGSGFRLAEAGLVLRRPALWLLAFFIFLYVACEVGVWNWLATYLMSRGIDKTRALNILSLGFALGLLIGRIVVSRVLIRVSARTVTLGASVAMALTTYWMVESRDPTVAWIAVFLPASPWRPSSPPRSQ